VRKASVEAGIEVIRLDFQAICQAAARISVVGRSDVVQPGNLYQPITLGRKIGGGNLPHLIVAKRTFAGHRP